MIDNSKYLPVKDDEHDFVHDMAVKTTLGWNDTPIFDSMEEWWYDYFMLKTYKDLRTMFKQFVFSKADSGKGPVKVALARNLARTFNMRVRHGE